MKSLESYETESDSCINNYQENDKKPIKSSSLSISYISDDNINRCWFFFSDIILSQKSLTNILINYKLDKGQSPFIIGNELSCYWIGISKIHYKCIESKNNYCIKKITWNISIDIGFSIRKTYLIYPITNNNKTLIKLVLDIIHPNNNEPLNFEENKEYFYKLQNSIIKNIANLMGESKKQLYIQESFIAKTDLETAWKNIINLPNLSKVTSGIFGENYVSNGDPEKIGTFWKCNLKNNNKTIYLRVKKIVKNKKRKKWIYLLETIGANVNIIRQEIEISITKINEHSNQISVLIIFHDKIDKNLYEYKKKVLNETMKIIKIFINKGGN